MTAATDYDVLIVGGGMVGASLACALADRDMRIGIIEAVPFRAASQPSYDDRSTALAWGTRQIFATLGLWEPLAPHATPIRHIHISDRGRFGITRLDAREQCVDALGYVVENRVLGAMFAEVLAARPRIDVHSPAELTGLRFEPACASAQIRAHGNNQTLTARLVVGADGGNSAVRRLLNIDARRWDYGQTAIISNVTPDRPHREVAYERFTASGALALLPMTDNRCSVVWTARSADVDALLALDDDAFLAALQRRFGDRLGRFQRVGTRQAYPLSLTRAMRHVAPRAALIGNASHTLHPVAGQGFNLGLRDAAALAEVVAQAVAAGEDPGSQAVLQRYARWRHGDHQRIIAFTDGLVRVFSNPLPPVAWARNLGLLAVDVLPVAKRLLTRQTMGIAGRQTRLARGLPL